MSKAMRLWTGLEHSGLLVLMGMAVAGAALADPTPDPRDRASFQIVVTREVANDWATARLTAMEEGQDPAQIASVVNARIARALARAKREKGIEVESGGYFTQPMYDGNRIVRWQASQELRLSTGDVDRLSRVIGALQEEKLTLSGIGFSVKRETREALEAELIEAALAKFRKRADLVARGMASSAWSLISLAVGQSGVGGPPVYAMRAEAAMYKSGAAPAFETGKSDLQVTVDGTIELD